MCQAVKDLIKDAVKEEKEKTKEANKQIKAEKAKNKAALLRIKELEKMVKNLQAQLKTAQTLVVFVVFIVDNDSVIAKPQVIRYYEHTEYAW